MFLFQIFISLIITQKQERKIASASRSLYTLAAIIIKFNSKFLKIQNMIFPIVQDNVSKTPKL